MNAVVEADRSATSVAVSDAATVLQVIERAASNPAVDVDKLERLLAVQERLVSRQAEADFNNAMMSAQTEMRPISADATNPQTRSRYATYNKLDNVLRPIYTRHGFSLSFSDGETAKQDYVRVVCTVRHRGGHKETHYKDMPADGKGAKGGDVMTKTHAVGAAQSYGMRYLLKGVFNVAVGEDDRDGNDEEAATITAKQVADLEALISEVGANKASFLKYIKTNSLSAIPAASYAGCVRALEAKRR